MTRTLPAVLVLALVLPEVALAAPPRLVWGAGTACYLTPDGKRIRAQCDDTTKVCRVAPDCVDPNAKTCVRPERVGWCNDQSFDTTGYEQLLAGGYALEPASPELQPGFYRDEEGRAFQIDFDLNRRFFLGSGWALARGDTRADDARLTLDMGFRFDERDGDGGGKTRYHFFDTSLALVPFELRASFMKVDRSNDSREPFLRITTFIGKPARHDLYLTIGHYFELLSLEHRPRGSVRDTPVRFIGGGLTWDLWHDADWTSFFRVRAGLALDDFFIEGAGRGRVALVPLAGIDADITLDRRGFHHLGLSSTYEHVQIESAPDEAFITKRRFLSELSYEVILVALNDQPLSLRASVGGGYRDDLSDESANGWQVEAGVALRFSLWAPPREHPTEVKQ